VQHQQALSEVPKIIDLHQILVVAAQQIVAPTLPREAYI
jgi:hypothetical protein